MLLTGVILNVILCILWCGFNFLVALGAAYGNQESHNGVDIRIFFVVLISATIAVCVGVWFLPEDLAKIALGLPLLIVVCAHVLIWFAGREDRAKNRAWKVQVKEEREPAQAKVNEQLSWVTPDFICDRKSLPQELSQSFLVIGAKHGDLVRVDVEKDGGPGPKLNSYAIGRVVDGRLRIHDKKVMQHESEYRHYVNSDGKTIFDVYEVNFTGKRKFWFFRIGRLKEERERLSAQAKKDRPVNK